MNVRMSLPVATLVALWVAVPTTLQGAPGAQPGAPAGSPTASSPAGAYANTPTAAEAARLAAAAADMAQRAAKLAEQAQHSVDSSSTWRRRGESEKQPAATAPAAYPTTSTPAPTNPAASAAAQSADQAAQDGSLRWRQIFATEEDRQQQAPGAAATLASIGADLAAPFAGQSSADTSLESPKINDSEVIPASDAQYPEALPAGPEYATAASFQGCGDAGCGDVYCGDVACCPPRRPLFWIMGAEATFLNPDLSGRSPTLEVEDITFDTFSSFSAGQADVDSFYVSPRIWLGIQGCKWGTQVRYWNLQASEFEFDGFFDNNGSSDYGIPDAAYFASGRLDAYTIDWEITRRFCVHNCEMMLSGGVRYALLEADSSVTGLVETLTDPMDDETGVILNGYSRSDALTRGTGLVLGLSGRLPLFPCSCVNLFWNARGSVLWGTTETYAESNANVMVFDPDAVANAFAVESANTSVDDNMWIGEFQLGLEWDYCLCCIPANAFVRVAAEYQRWDGGPGRSETGAFAAAEVGGDDVAILETFAQADGPQLDLIGLSIGAGLTW